MEISFSKFQGTGNDFVIMDAWEQEINLSTDQIRHTCDR
ncbi:MAG: diaminopimelate epimerase, partial [Bacteroidia bacterium]|nr:diaminopimelate epimerase [Bacteroidia bacterium]